MIFKANIRDFATLGIFYIYMTFQLTMVGSDVFRVLSYVLNIFRCSRMVGLVGILGSGWGVWYTQFPQPT